MPLSSFPYCVIVEFDVDEVRYSPHIGRSGNGKDKIEGQHDLRRHACMQPAPEVHLKNET